MDLTNAGFFLKLYCMQFYSTDWTTNALHEVLKTDATHFSFTACTVKVFDPPTYQPSTIPTGLTVFLLFLIKSSFVSRWLYKSVIAIFDSIIIIVINDYEYYSTMSIHLSHCVHQDKNKDSECECEDDPRTCHWSALLCRLEPLFSALQCVRNLSCCLCTLGFTWWFPNNYLYFGKLKAWLPQKER